VFVTKRYNNVKNIIGKYYKSIYNSTPTEKKNSGKTEYEKGKGKEIGIEAFLAA
jgi:hypothetical protein